MNSRTALVTGASGFVGTHLTERLVDCGWQVHAVVRPSSQPKSTLASGVTYHAHDGSTASLLDVLGGTKPDVVFHIASLFLSEHTAADVDRLVQSNLLFGTQLLEAMRRVGVKSIVNTGTAWQHFESREYSPVNLYAATKQAFEDLMLYYVEVHGVNAITLKLHDTYGPRDGRRKLIGLLCELAANPRPLAMSPGAQVLDLVHVDDVTRAFVIAAERLVSGATKGHECYSLESGKRMTLREVVGVFEEVAGVSIPIVWGGRPYRVREVMHPWRSDKVLPGWKPEIDLRTGLAGLSSASR